MIHLRLQICKHVEEGCSIAGTDSSPLCWTHLSLPNPLQWILFPSNYPIFFMIMTELMSIPLWKWKSDMSTNLLWTISLFLIKQIWNLSLFEFIEFIVLIWSWTSGSITMKSLLIHPLVTPLSPKRSCSALVFPHLGLGPDVSPLSLQVAQQSRIWRTCLSGQCHMHFSSFECCTPIHLLNIMYTFIIYINIFTLVGS